MATKPNCYKCIHRGTCPGSCHSSCNHPSTLGAARFALVASILTRGRAVALRPLPEGGHAVLEVKGSPHGISNGWFTWPVDFDPTWLEVCSGFTSNEEQLIPQRFLEVK